MPDQAPTPPTPGQTLRAGGLGRAGGPARPRCDRAPDELAHSVAAAARGDERAFSTLHARLDPGLRRMLLKRTGAAREDLADELAQRTWTTTWQALVAGKYDPDRAAFSTFLYAVGMRAWLQHLRESSRKSGRPEALPDDDVGVIPETDDPESLVGFAELLDAVRACLRGDEDVPTLTDSERAIVAASARGEPDRTAARNLDLASSTFNARKLAALGKIRRRLARLGFRFDEHPQQGADHE